MPVVHATRWFAALLVMSACACVRYSTELDRPPPTPAAPLTHPLTLCLGETPDRACRSAEEVERWLAHPDLEILGTDQTPAGKQGAQVLTLRRPADAGEPAVVFRAKWRAQSTATKLNSPRRELATYALQRLLLEPHDYVVPPAAAHCFPLEHYRLRVDRAAKPTFTRVPCVLGVLSFWLEDVQTLPDAGEAGWFDWEGGPLDEDLFEKSPVYRDSVADMNLVTYLIGHADSHWKQFVIREDPEAPVVYAVDNSMSFGAPKNEKVSQDWSEIRVPALRGATVERLRGLEARLGELATIAELKVDGARMIPVPRRPPIAPHGRPVLLAGDRLQVTLRPSELEGLRHRIRALIARIDRGEIEVY